MDASSNPNAALLIGNSAGALVARGGPPAQPAGTADRVPTDNSEAGNFSSKFRELQSSEEPAATPPPTAPQREQQPASATETPPATRPDADGPAPPPAAVAGADGAGSDAAKPASAGEFLPLDGKPLPDELSDTAGPAPVVQPGAGDETLPAATPTTVDANAPAPPSPAASGTATDGAAASATASPLIAAAPAADDPPPARPVVTAAAQTGSAETPRPLPPSGAAPAVAPDTAGHGAAATPDRMPLPATLGGDSAGPGHGQAGDGHGRQSESPGATTLRDILLPAQPAARGPVFADAGALAASSPGASATSAAPPALGQLLGQATAGLAQQPLQALAGEEQFARGLGERLTLLAGNGLQAARIQLHPERLGTLDVRIELDDNQARVWFHAQHAGTRDALEQALPRLREMLAGQGLELLDAGVSGGQEQQAGQHAEPRPNDWLASRRLANGFDEASFAARVERRLSSERLLDVRA